MRIRTMVVAVSVMVAVPAFASGTQELPPPPMVEVPPPPVAPAAARPATGIATYLFTGGLLGAGVGGATWFVMGGYSACASNSSWCTLSLAYLGILGGGGAAVGLLVGGIWYGLDHTWRQPLALLPVVGPQGNGFALTGTF